MVRTCFLERKKKGIVYFSIFHLLNHHPERAKRELILRRFSPAKNGDLLQFLPFYGRQNGDVSVVLDTKLDDRAHVADLSDFYGPQFAVNRETAKQGPKKQQRGG